MKFLKLMFLLLAILLLGAWGWTHYQSAKIEERHPPAGTVATIDGRKVHYVYQKGGEGTPVLFVHGASGNLLDQHLAFSGPIKPIANAIFVDRPGHGYSERLSRQDSDPSVQAALYKNLLDHIGIDKVVLVGHSMGSASVAAFAVHYPERVKGLVFLAPATHPWPGGVTWYYELASIPVIGWLFTELLALPAGQTRIQAGVTSVFAPNEPPKDYAQQTAASLVFRPRQFRANAEDVADLKAHLEKLSPRYREITAPTSIITGDQDDVVLAEIHSEGLARDIEGSKLIERQGVGHKPDYVLTDLIIDEIQRVSR